MLRKYFSLAYYYLKNQSFQNYSTILGSFQSSCCLTNKQLLFLIVYLLYQIKYKMSTVGYNRATTLVFLLIGLASTQFASYQFQITSVTPYTAGSYSVSLTFPAPSSPTYTQSVALAGFQMEYHQVINFDLSVQTPCSTTAATINLAVHNDTTIHGLSVYVLLIDNSSNWIWVQDNVYEGSSHLNKLNGYNGTSLTAYYYGCSPIAAPQSYLVGSNCYSLPTQVYYYFFLTSFYAEALPGQTISIKTTYTSGNKIFPNYNFTNNNFDINFSRNSNDSIIDHVKFVAVFFNLTQTNTFNIANYSSIITIDSTLPTFLTGYPNNFSIPSAFATPTFDGNCVIGINSMQVASGNSSFVRSVWFDTTTIPISNIMNAVDSSESVYEKFQVKLQIMCFVEISCAANTFLNTSTQTCQACSLPNCVECLTYNLCQVCSASTHLDVDFQCKTCKDIYSFTVGMYWGCLTCNYANFNMQCFTCAVGSGLSISLGMNHCPSTTYCNTCSNPGMIPNCLECLNSTYCTKCNFATIGNVTYGGYVSFNNQFCLSCNDIPNCLYCSVNAKANEYNCTRCINNSLCVDSQQKCSRCSDLMPYCLTCSSRTNCLTWPIGYGFNSANLTCYPCNSLSIYCTACSANYCTSCSSGFQPGPKGCTCITGIQYNGHCINVTGCSTPYQMPNGQYGCAACDTSQYQQALVDGKCVCLNGTQINGVCSTVNGCITVKKINNTEVCIACNVTAGFYLFPVSGDCLCPAHMQPNASLCTDICGDGLMMINQTNYCDDGNNVSGDGCSSKCAVEVGFKCVNGNQSVASKCRYVYKMPVISVKSIARTLGANQGVFTFSISPSLLSIGYLQLDKAVTLSCDDTNYTIGQQQYKNGILSLKANYTEDMQGKLCMLQLSYNRSLIDFNDSALNFSALGENIPLTITQDLQKYQIMKFIFKFLSYICLVLLFLSSIHKMIGPELIFTCQIVYLSNLFGDTSTMMLSAVRELKWITGGWSFISDSSSTDTLLNFVSTRIDISKYFFQTNLFVASALLVLSCPWLILMIYRGLKVQPNDNFVLNKQVEATKIDLIIKYIYRLLIFPITASFLCPLLISIFVSNIKTTDQLNPLVSYSLNSIITQATVAIVAAIAGIQVLYINAKILCKEAEMGGLESAQKWYIPLFLVRTLILACLFEIGLTMKFHILLFPILAVQAAYLIFLIVKPPYSTVMHKLGVINCEINALFAIILGLLRMYIKIQQVYEIFILLILQGMIMLAITFALIRTLLSYRPLFVTLCQKLKQICFRKAEEVQKQNQLDKQKIPNREKQVLRQGAYVNPYSLQGQGLMKNGNQQGKKITEKIDSLPPFVDNSSQSEQINQIKNRLRDSLLIHKNKNK